MSTARPLVGFVLEQTLGHITHTSNLVELVGADDRIDARFLPVDFAVEGWPARVPGYGNWTVRSGLRARRALRTLRREHRPDALFFHTQVPAVLNLDAVRRTPTVVSLDATPRQYDELGVHYEHETGGRRIEQAKWRANRACFAAATAIVTWAAWTKEGLVTDYGVDPDKVHVIPPGVNAARWGAPAARDGDGPLRVLFVGGDLVRKGGDVLVAAVEALRNEGVAIEVDLVTRDELTARPGVRVHHGLTPNSEELVALYRQADVFCLPTLGDCLPMVLSEAGSVGLPVVSTDVGAIREIVREGTTGLLVPPGDADALATALRRLADDPALRRRLGAGASEVTASEFDAATNARRLVDVLLAVAAGRRS
jgi:glycosyltransferase involved in cell wall biosynthesis